MAHRAVSEIPINNPERELPPLENRAINPDWNERAEQIGGALGRAVSKAREIPRRADEIRSEMRERFEIIRNRSREGSAGMATRLREAAGQKAEEAEHEKTFTSRGTALIVSPANGPSKSSPRLSVSPSF